MRTPQSSTYTVYQKKIHFSTNKKKNYKNISIFSYLQTLERRDNMYSIQLFYIFFCVLAISSIWIIVMRWKRYMKYSNGTYKNAGQNLIFKTELSQNEIIRKLETHDAKDTLDYDFYEKNGEYFLKVKGVKRLVFNGILTADFKVDFLENAQRYIIVHQGNNFQMLYSSGYEAEIFEFMVKKLNCIPQEKING